MDKTIIRLAKSWQLYNLDYQIKYGKGYAKTIMGAKNQATRLARQKNIKDTLNLYYWINDEIAQNWIRYKNSQRWVLVKIIKNQKTT